jgi:hypothetical protein
MARYREEVAAGGKATSKASYTVSLMVFMWKAPRSEVQSAILYDAIEAGQPLFWHTRFVPHSRDQLEALFRQLDVPNLYLWHRLKGDYSGTSFRRSVWKGDNTPARNGTKKSRSKNSCLSDSSIKQSI